MPIKSITIVIEPTPAFVDKPVRILTYSKETKRWSVTDTSETTGLYSGEIKLIAAINEIRGNNLV